MARFVRELNPYLGDDLVVSARLMKAVASEEDPLFLDCNGFGLPKRGPGGRIRSRSRRLRRRGGAT